MHTSETVRICTSIPAYTSTLLQETIEKAFTYGSDYVEIRFDYLDINYVDRLNSVLSKYADRCIYTCRRAIEGGMFKGDEKSRLELLSKLAEQNPAFIDIELNTVKEKPHLADRRL